MKQILIDNFTKATPGANDPTPANKLIYRMYVSQSPEMNTVTDLLTNGELAQTAVIVDGEITGYTKEKVDADSFTWITDREGTWHFQIAVISPIGGIQIYDQAQSIDLTPGVNFEILVDTTQSGVSGNNQFQLTGAIGTYSVTYDGKTEELTGEQTLTFGSPGQKIIKISGGLESIAFANGGDANKLLEIQQWGNIRWQTFEEAFFGCTNLVVTATDVPVMSDVTSMVNMFANNNSFVVNQGIENMDVSKVGDLEGVFNSMYANDPETVDIDLTGWQLNTDPASTGTLNNIFRNSGLTREAYSKFLISQANRVYAGHGPEDVSMTGQFQMLYNDDVYDLGGQFDNAVSAREYLVTTAGWTITNDELVTTAIPADPVYNDAGFSNSPTSITIDWADVPEADTFEGVLEDLEGITVRTFSEITVSNHLFENLPAGTKFKAKTRSVGPGGISAYAEELVQTDDITPVEETEIQEATTGS